MRQLKLPFRGLGFLLHASLRRRRGGAQRRGATRPWSGPPRRRRLAGAGHGDRRRRVLRVAPAASALSLRDGGLPAQHRGGAETAGAARRRGRRRRPDRAGGLPAALRRRQLRSGDQPARVIRTEGSLPRSERRRDLCHPAGRQPRSRGPQADPRHAGGRGGFAWTLDTCSGPLRGQGSPSSRRRNTSATAGSTTSGHSSTS